VLLSRTSDPSVAPIAGDAIVIAPSPTTTAMNR